LNYFSNYTEELKREAREKAKQPGSTLSIEHLRSEAQSDIFATSVLLVATINIMREAGERFRLEQLIVEVIIFINIIVLFQRCKDMAKIVSHPISDYDARLEVAFAPLSFYVRLSIVTRYREWAIYPQAVDIKRLSQEDLIRTRDQNRNLIDQIMGTFADILNDVEVGLARAMRFALFPTEREQDLLSKFAVELSDPVSRVLAETEAKAFCELAESLGVISYRMQTKHCGA
jgi:hypothetical protein